MKIAVILASSILWATPAAATNWYRVSSNDVGVFYVDTDTLERTGAAATGWEYAIWYRPTRSGMTSSKTRLQVNCSDRSYRNQYHITYDTSGRSDGFAGDGQTRFAAPGTNIESVINFMCGDYSVGVRLIGVTPEEDARRRGN